MANAPDRRDDRKHIRITMAADRTSWPSIVGGGDGDGDGATTEAAAAAAASASASTTVATKRLAVRRKPITSIERTRKLSLLLKQHQQHQAVSVCVGDQLCETPLCLKARVLVYTACDYSKIRWRKTV